MTRKMLRFGKRGLMLVDDQEIRVFPASGAVGSEAVFSRDDAGLARLSEWLAARRGGVFEVVSNLSGDEFLVEALPSGLSGRDRRAVLQRLRARHFEGQPYVLSRTLAARNGGQPDGRVLLAALPAPFLKRLIETLTVNGAALAGLYDFALLLGEAGQSALPETALFFTRHSGAVRETFFLRGEAVFSRMVSPPEQEAARPWLTEEAESLRRYLMTRGLMARGAPLTVCSFAGCWRMEADDSEIPCAVAPLVERLIGADSGLFLLEWLSRHKPETQFASRALRMARFVPWIRRGAAALGGAFFVAGIGLGLLFWRQAEALSPCLSELRLKVEDLRARPSAAEDSNLRPESGDWPVFFARYDAARRAAGQACLEFALPSEPLEAHPNARLDQLRWRCEANRTTVSMIVRFSDLLARDAFEDWVSDWRPSGWRVVLPEEGSDAFIGRNAEEAERTVDALSPADAPVFYLRLERDFPEMKAP